MRKANTQSFEVKIIKRIRNPLLWAFSPPLGHPQIAIVLYSCSAVIAMRPRPPQGTDCARGGNYDK